MEITFANLAIKPLQSYSSFIGVGKVSKICYCTPPKSKITAWISIIGTTQHTHLWSVIEFKLIEKKISFIVEYLSFYSHIWLLWHLIWTPYTLIAIVFSTVLEFVMCVCAHLLKLHTYRIIVIGLLWRVPLRYAAIHFFNCQAITFIFSHASNSNALAILLVLLSPLYLLRISHFYRVNWLISNSSRKNHTHTCSDSSFFLVRQFK